MHHCWCWWSLIQAGLFLTNKGNNSIYNIFGKNPYPVCGVRQPRNLGHEDSVDLTLQSADYKVTGLEFLTISTSSVCPLKYDQNIFSNTIHHSDQLPNWFDSQTDWGDGQTLFRNDFGCSRSLSYTINLIYINDTHFPLFSTKINLLNVHSRP